MRIFLWLLGFIAVVVLSSFVSWGVEYLTDSLIWMLIAFGLVFVAGCWVLVKIYLRQDDLEAA